MKEINKKIAAVKSELGIMAKDSSNPFHGSRYFDINALLGVVEPVLSKHGLLLIQPIYDGRVTTKIIDIETGEEISSVLALSEDPNPQKRGSEITYYRRYTLVSLLAIQAEDDDGNAAIPAPTKRANTPTPNNPTPAPKPSSPNEPESWLNKEDKEGFPTAEWASVVDRFKAGEITSVADVRKLYKVSRAIAAELNQIGIQ